MLEMSLIPISLAKKLNAALETRNAAVRALTITSVTV